jgi:hypothetical protein
MNISSIVNVFGQNPIWNSSWFWTMSDNILFNNRAIVVCSIFSSVTDLQLLHLNVSLVNWTYSTEMEIFGSQKNQQMHLINSL